MKMLIARFFSPLLVFLCASSAVHAQLQITEVVPTTVDSNDWEWIELRNTGATDLDLNGYYLDDDDGTPRSSPNIVNSASGGMATNTSVPAGGVAVLYDGDALSYDDSRFRAAWNLPASVALIGVDGWSNLNESGDPVSLWSSQEDYEADLTSDLSDHLTQNSAAASIDYGTGFPDVTGTHSLAWNGTGSYTDGSQWASSYDTTTMAPISPAVTSVATFLPGGAPINSAEDTGNPGVLSDYAEAQTGILITEIMYDPRSSESAFEWIEIYNNSGDDLDFAATPHTLDDNDGGLRTEPNVDSGIIPNGSVAILYDEQDITAAEMEAAWGSGINFIGISDWPGLANEGDSIGFWDGLTNYINGEDPPGQNFDDPFSGVASVIYDNDGTDWPANNGSGSIHLDGTNSTTTQNWVLSEIGDGISFSAMEIISGAVADHAGGDVGSPGSFGGGGADALTCDFDADGDCQVDDIDALYATGDVSAADIDAWLVAASSSSNSANPGGNTLLRGDINLDGNVNSSDLGLLLNNFNASGNLGWGGGNLNDDGVVNSSDLGQLLNNFGTSASSAAVPEPSSSAMLLAVFGVILCLRRHLGA